MNLYQIIEITEKFNNAGTKANADVAQVAERLGFKPVPVRMNTMARSIVGKIQRQIGYYADWKKASKTIPEEAIVLLQHPFHHQQLTRKESLRELKEKGIRFISLVHDVEELRGFRFSEYYKQEFNTMLAMADVLIVHNGIMKHWFVGHGVPEEKLVTLEIFDYLQPGSDSGKKVFTPSLAIAGNLDTAKCGYIAELGKVTGVHFDLYGANFDRRLLEFENIQYHGEFPIDVIPSKLNRGFGLVWDGSSITGCEGEAGEYLRYNNPHKMSLYLSSGLPIVIWSGAAEAGFIRDRGAGICIDSLLEMDTIFKKMTEEEYKNLCDNAAAIAPDLRSGQYAEKALTEALYRVKQRRR